jgi:hypothetical protein
MKIQRIPKNIFNFSELPIIEALVKRNGLPTVLRSPLTAGHDAALEKLQYDGVILLLPDQKYRLHPDWKMRAKRVNPENQPVHHSRVKTMQSKVSTARMYLFAAWGLTTISSAYWIGGKEIYDYANMDGISVEVNGIMAKEAQQEMIKLGFKDEKPERLGTSKWRLTVI